MVKRIRNMKNRLLFTLWCVWAAVCIGLNIWLKEWSDIVWIGCVTLLLYYIFSMDRYIDACLNIIKKQSDDLLCAETLVVKLKNHDVYKQLREYSKQIECYRANCERALNHMVRLKAENKQLKTLNKNLIENQSKRRKNYGRGSKNSDRAI